MHYFAASRSTNRMMNWLGKGLIALILAPALLFAQTKPYPKGYFRSPLDIPMQLVANFGELRTNHWHMGLDIRTEQKENLPVHAAAEGYIARIKIEPGGFGRAIYINHPNGYTTLYAHLNDFFPALEKYVKEQQYRLELWSVELDIPQNLFPVKKGGLIAYSGNTGGSQGPHVHFEIRDTKTEKCLNPLLFGMPIPDAVPPTISRLAMYNRNKSVYAQNPQWLALKKAGATYSLASGLIKLGSDKISFAIAAADRFTGYTNPNGIYSARILMDGNLESEFILDAIDYTETRYLNAQIDYKYKFNGGSYVQHLSHMPGDVSRVYTETASEGVLSFTDFNPHDVRIEVSDAAQNVSVLQFKVQYDPSLKTAISSLPLEVLTPQQVNVYETEGFELFTSEYSVYDTVPATHTVNNERTANAISPLHTFCSGAIPTHDSVRVRIQSSVTPTDKNKLVIKSVAGTRTVIEKAQWQNGWISAKFRQFGSFQAFIDTEPPTINTAPSDLSRASKIVFIPKDNFKTIKNLRAEVDGQWLRFTNDKGLSWIYKFDEHFPTGMHELKVTVEDEAGNSTTKTWSVRR